MHIYASCCRRFFCDNEMLASYQAQTCLKHWQQILFSQILNTIQLPIVWVFCLTFGFSLVPLYLSSFPDLFLEYLPCFLSYSLCHSCLFLSFLSLYWSSLFSSSYKFLVHFLSSISLDHSASFAFFFGYNIHLVFSSTLPHVYRQLYDIKQSWPCRLVTAIARAVVPTQRLSTQRPVCGAKLSPGYLSR